MTMVYAISKFNIVLQLRTRTKSAGFEGFAVIASLHMVNDGFHLPKVSGMQLKMCNGVHVRVGFI